MLFRSLNEKLHRIGMPAIRKWNRFGRIIREVWLINNIMHREDAPAYRYWYHDGRLHYEAWWINGNDLKNKELEEYKLWLDTYNLFNKNYQLWSDEEKILWKLRWN